MPPYGVDTTIFLPVVLSGADSDSISTVVNGGFEEGSHGWGQYSKLGYDNIVSSSFLQSYAHVSPYAGDYAAWLGGADNEVGYVEQEVYVAAGSSTLAYRRYISSGDQCGFDYGGVLVRQNGGLRTLDVFNLCRTTQTYGWDYATLDLGAYAGQLIGIQFRVETDVSYHSSLFIDDVSFEGASAAAALAETGETVSISGAPARPALDDNVSAQVVVPGDQRLFPQPGKKSSQED